MFHKIYFVDNYEINTLLIYGIYELIFSEFINNFYFHLSIGFSQIGTITKCDRYPKNFMAKINKNDFNNNFDLNEGEDSIYLFLVNLA